MHGSCLAGWPANAEYGPAHADLVPLEHFPSGSWSASVSRASCHVDITGRSLEVVEQSESATWTLLPSQDRRKSVHCMGALPGLRLCGRMQA